MDDYQRRYAALQEVLDLALFGVTYGLREGDTAESLLRVLVDELLPHLENPPYALLALQAGLSLEDALKVEAVVEAAHAGRAIPQQGVPANVINFAERVYAARKGSEPEGTSSGYEGTSVGTRSTSGEEDGGRDSRIVALLREGRTGEAIYREVGGKRAATMRRIKELRRVA